MDFQGFFVLPRIWAVTAVYMPYVGGHAPVLDGLIFAFSIFVIKLQW